MDFEIFKVGKHTSANGKTINYTTADLQGIIKNLNDSAPIVVGHPKDNSPAFGWIDKLYMKGESLFAHAKDLVPEFVSLLKKKIYKNRSVSLSQNEDGTFALNHVGFLGGTMPAVKDLQALNLNADSDKNIVFEFAETLEEVIYKKPNESLVLPKTSKDLTETLESLQATILEMKENAKNLRIEFMETINSMQTTDTKEVQAKIDELNTQLSIAYFQSNLIDKLKMNDLTPALQDKITSLLSYFKTLNFSKEKHSVLLSDFQELVDLIVPFQTTTVIPKSKPKEKMQNEFENYNVDENSMLFHNKTVEYSKKNNITYNEALNILITEMEN